MKISMHFKNVNAHFWQKCPTVEKVQQYEKDAEENSKIKTIEPE